MTTRHFYVSLRSDASANFHPSNTTSRFVAVLPQPGELKGDEWEVALKEIALPCVSNVRRCEHWLRWNGVKIGLRDGHYNDVSDVLEALAKRINNAGRRDWPSTCVIYSPDSWWRNSECDLNIFLYGPNLVYFEFRNKKPRLVRFSPALAEMLGLDDEEYSNPHAIGSSRSCRVHVPTTAYVYADIVRPVTVGDDSVPLLRTVVLNSKRTDRQLVDYESPIYVPTNDTTSFRSIEVNITTDVGKPMSFGAGNASLLLHFRRAT